jgi:hypothetical protein
MQAIGMTCSVPLKHLNQGPRIMGGRDCRKGSCRSCNDRSLLEGRPSLFKRADEILDGLGLPDRL